MCLDGLHVRFSPAHDIRRRVPVDRRPKVAGELHVRDDALLRQNRVAHPASVVDDRRACFHDNNTGHHIFIFVVPQTSRPNIQPENGRRADRRVYVQPMCLADSKIY